MNFLHKLQNAPRSVKDRWIMLFTAIAVIIVMFVWFKYFNNLLGINSGGGEAESGRSFIETLGNGFRIVGATLSDWLGNISGWIAGPKEINVQP